MNIALVKIDVATVDLGKSVRKIEQLVDGGRVHDRALLWVFNLAHNPSGKPRVLRFWRPELLARGQGEPGKYHHCKLDDIITLILPINRNIFHAGEVSELFQIRHNTRLELFAAAGQTDGRNFYSRPALAKFLQQRWLGASQGKAFRHEKS